jgi:hypothetical protein
MAESKPGGLRWGAIGLGLGLGLVAVAAGAWLMLGRSPEGVESTRTATTASVAGSAAKPPAADPDAAAPGLRIVAHGRLTLDAAALPDEGPLLLTLDLADEMRGSGNRGIRIISGDGRRLDTTGIPHAGAGSGLLLEIDTGFLSTGRYMVEVETAQKHPLQILRYVLEIE